MDWSVSPFVLIECASAAVALAVGAAALRERPDPMAVPLATLMFTAVAWAVPHAISLGYSDVGRVAFWNQLRYPGTVLAPLLYFAVTVKYAGRERWLSRRILCLLAVVPVLTVVVVGTNQYHGLFWRSLSTDVAYGATILVPQYGPWYWVNLGYLYLLTCVGLVVLASVILEQGPVYRQQAAVMFAGGAIPLGTNVVINLGVSDGSVVDLTPTALVVSGLLFALALFHFDLLQIRPVAHDRLIEELDDAVIVVGPDGRVREFNPISARVLTDIAVGCPVAEILPSNVSLDGGELVTTVDGTERTFRSRTTPLRDESDRNVGQIVYLNEITEIVEREQRISVLNRVLRHNIRNELNIVTGYLEELDVDADSHTASHLQTVKRSTRRITDYAEKARIVERTLQQGENTETVSAAVVAERVVSNARTEYPRATIEYDGGGVSETETRVRVVDSDLFARALAEIVENAVVHNDNARPQVSVHVATDRDEGRVRVSVSDNGPGIPREETEILTARTETPLSHGSGIGLWLVSWAASLSSAELTFSRRDAGGTDVTLTLEAAS